MDEACHKFLGRCKWHIGPHDQTMQLDGGRLQHNLRAMGRQCQWKEDL